jgi:hypothetical protein
MWGTTAPKVWQHYNPVSGVPSDEGPAAWLNVGFSVALANPVCRSPPHTCSIQVSRARGASYSFASLLLSVRNCGFSLLWVDFL